MCFAINPLLILEIEARLLSVCSAFKMGVFRCKKERTPKCGRNLPACGAGFGENIARPVTMQWRAIRFTDHQFMALGCLLRAIFLSSIIFNLFILRRKR